MLYRTPTGELLVRQSEITRLVDAVIEWREASRAHYAAGNDNREARHKRFMDAVVALEQIADEWRKREAQ